jgi:predicted HD phosphohydrolase
MFLHVIEAKYINDYQVWLEFNDKTKGIADFISELEGEIFEPLKNIDYFKNFKLEGYTLNWDNGADFAPEFLKSIVIENKNTIIPSHNQET